MVLTGRDGHEATAVRDLEPSAARDARTDGRAGARSPTPTTRIIGWDDLRAAADEAADIGALVRRELERAPRVEVAPLRALGPSCRPARRSWPVTLLLGLSVLGLGAIVVIDGRQADTSRPAPSIAAVPTPAPDEAPTVPERARAERRHLTVRLAFSAPCWVRAVADGRTALSETMTDGTSVVRARRTIDLTLGNAGGVRVKVDGRAVPTGSPGEVVHLVFRLEDGRVLVDR